jgi:hypothetical protein
MNKSSSLPSLEELLVESVDRRGHKMKVGIPHPLVRFGLSGSFQDNEYADAVADFIVDTVGAEPDTAKYQTAVWFLLDSEQAFFTVCSKAGIDAEKLRQHLRKQISPIAAG